MIASNGICYNCFMEKKIPEGTCPYCGYDHAEHAAKYPMALTAGGILNGQYIVGRVLGQGGFGITYLAFDYQLKVKVAIKEYMPDGMATRLPETTLVSVYTGEKQENFEYGAERFLDEARVLAKFLGNKNIAGVKSYFNENNTSYFVMDYIEGISFKSYIQNQGGKIGYSDALRVLVPVLRALSVVHREGFIHRDVTPDNIYITKDGEIKLLDFGSARYSLGDKSKSLDVILKAGYAPKEQYMRRGKQGPYTDVYSAAACFYAAITGYLPPEALERMEEDELVAPSSRGVKLPAYLEDAILKGLEVKAEDRYQSAEEFLFAIEQGQLNEAGTIAAPTIQPVLPAQQTQAGAAGGVSQNIAAATQQSGTPQQVLEQPTQENTQSMPSGASLHNGGVSEFFKKYKIAIGVSAAAFVVLIIALSGALRSTQKPASAEPPSLPQEASAVNANPSLSEETQIVADQPYIYLTAIGEMTGQYSGEWSNGEPNGRGTFIIAQAGSNGTAQWEKGDTFTGTFENGKLTGQGTTLFACGNKYVGEYQNGLPNGYGTFTRMDGSEYAGSFVDACYCGVGTMIYSDGTKYSGEWKDGRPNGQGCFYDADGTLLFDGEWINGEPQIEQTPAPQSVPFADQYVIYDSSTRLLDPAELKAYTSSELRLARNEIYARHGMMFKDRSLQSHFESTDWYVPTIEPGDFTDEMYQKIFSDLEKENIRRIKAEEKSR